jgi:hypothetical protein
MDKKCIFSSVKQCNQCGDCDICDLDKNKTCNNCGKCLQLEGMDIKAIRIDEISEEPYEFTEEIKVTEEALEKDNDDYTFLEEDIEAELHENNDEWELIDDIDGLEEVLEDDKLFKSVAQELYPGLISINRK